MSKIYLLKIGDSATVFSTPDNAIEYLRQRFDFLIEDDFSILKQGLLVSYGTLCFKLLETEVDYGLNSYRKGISK